MFMASKQGFEFQEGRWKLKAGDLSTLLESFIWNTQGRHLNIGEVVL